MRINNVTFTAFTAHTPFGDDTLIAFHNTGDFYLVTNTEITTKFDHNAADDYYNVAYGFGWRKHIKDVTKAIAERVAMEVDNLSHMQEYTKLCRQKELSAFAIQWLRTKTIELSIEQDKDKIAKWAATEHAYINEKGYTLIGEDGAVIMALTPENKVMYAAYLKEGHTEYTSNVKHLLTFKSDLATVKSWQGSINNILDRWGWKIKKGFGNMGTDKLVSKYDHVNYNGILYPIRMVKLPESSDYVTVATHDLGNVLMDNKLEYVNTLARTIGLGIYHYTDTVVFNGSAKELAHEAWIENEGADNYSELEFE